MNNDARLSWQKAKEYFDSFGDGAWSRKNLPMREIIAWIDREALSSELYVRFGLSGLWVSDRPHDTFGGHMLQIECTGEQVRFRYEKTPYATDGMTKTVQRPEVVEALRQFLAYKFGIYREGQTKEPNQALLPTPTAVTPPAGQESRQP